MRTHAALLLLVVAALAMAPAAQAQTSQMAVSLELAALEDDLDHGTRAATHGKLTVVADMTAALWPTGASVRYVVADLPPWASATISPESDVVVFPPGLALTTSVTKSFTVSIEADPRATSEEVGVLTVTALVTPNVPGHPGGTARASMPLRLASRDAEPCDEPHEAPGAPASDPSTQASALPDTTTSAPAPETPSPVTVQQASPPIAPTSYLAVAGFAAAGAGVGFLLRRRA